MQRRRTKNRSFGPDSMQHIERGTIFRKVSVIANGIKLFVQYSMVLVKVVRTLPYQLEVPSKKHVKNVIYT